MKNIIICDLDGTLADLRHRRHFVEKTKCGNCRGLGIVNTGVAFACTKCNGNGFFKPNWTAFHAACVDDTPLRTTIDLVVSRAMTTGDEIWIVSGRSDEVREQTLAWLNEHVGYYHKLIMRKSGDYTADDVLKKSWLDDGTIPKDRVFCVFDDRDRVVKMWRGEGLTCYQVAEGDF